MPRQARSLDVLLAEVNRSAPGRSKASDGGLGDPAHAARVSDHNPNAAGVWRARDFTNDPADGFDCDLFALYVASRLGKHPALGSGAYVIWNRRIISTDRLAEGWRPYTGASPHDHHCHVSVATAAAGYDSTAPWGWEDTMDKIIKLLEQILAEQKATRADIKDMRRALGQRVSAEADGVVEQLKPKE